MTEQESFTNAVEKESKRISASEAVEDDAGRKNLIEAPPPTLDWREKQNIVNAKHSAIEQLDRDAWKVQDDMLRQSQNLKSSDREGRKNLAWSLRKKLDNISNQRVLIARSENRQDVRDAMGDG